MCLCVFVYFWIECSVSLCHLVRLFAGADAIADDVIQKSLNISTEKANFNFAD